VSRWKVHGKPSPPPGGEPCASPGASSSWSPARPSSPSSWQLRHWRRRTSTTKPLEPPSGVEPDHPPYEGGAAAVRGGDRDRCIPATATGRINAGPGTAPGDLLPPRMAC